jgi:hypothetical protein
MHPTHLKVPDMVWLLLAVTLWIDHAAAEEVEDGPIPAHNEVVMTPEMRITATTSVGTITITAGKGLKRSYTWDGATRSVEMYTRAERWYGSLGLYYPGPGDHWREHKGITRGVVEEGQQHFKTQDEALTWLSEQKWAPHVWTSDGLAVGWRKYLPRRQLNVDVWQIYIDGEKPAKLPGSQDDSIVMDLPDEPPNRP